MTRSKFLKKLFFLISAIFIFVLANPNRFVKDGIGFLGFLIYFPVLFLVKNSTFKDVWLWGGFYGAFSYGFYAFWLKNFHPWALRIVCFEYFFVLAAVFLILKFIEFLFEKNFWIIQCVFLCAYEYLKTLGFCGFSYGVSAYTQWKNLYFIQTTQFFGVFGLNFLLIFLSAFLFGVILDFQSREENLFGENNAQKIKIYLKSFFKITEKSAEQTILAAGVLIWIFFMIFSYAFGIFTISRKKNYENSATVVAVQNNEDPWKNGIAEYSKNINSLIKLTREALNFPEKIDFVVWPETAVVPSILKHYSNNNDEKRRVAINSLLNFIEETDSVFAIGNSHEIKNERYNSVFVFEPKKNVVPPNPEIYSKIHLVPFTEYFPRKEKFPKFYEKLLNGDSNMWEKGSDYKVFDYKGLKFSTPICFEDTFGNDCRKFVKNGARCFMNLSNDAWSKSLVCQKQHLATAVFRCAENKIPAVRSSASGETCVINENGKIIAYAPPFCESYAIGKIPVFGENFKLSFYAKFGDYAGKIQVAFTIIILIIQTIRVIIEKSANKRKNHV